MGLRRYPINDGRAHLAGMLRPWVVRLVAALTK
jgi:hypothetical protein